MRSYVTLLTLHLVCLAILLPICPSTTVVAEASIHPDDDGGPISVRLWEELEEVARLVDISYCVNTPGIQKPFLCASRCHDFPHVELVTTWNTGPLFSDSCGYIAVSHLPSAPRIIVAFRGTYSVADTIVDLSALPQPYVPYPPPQPDADDDRSASDSARVRSGQQVLTRHDDDDDNKECPDCTVHAGFLYSWTLTRKIILPYLEELVEKYPDYRLILVGHSLGGAVAALAALEFHDRGWRPWVTTFGEPRVGNDALARYLDARFSLNDTSQVFEDNDTEMRYRRVTHTGDPVPSLPPAALGYRMHANEIFITKRELPPSVADIRHCKADEDPECIAGSRAFPWGNQEDDWPKNSIGWTLPVPVPGQSVLAHRDYFWRLGLCVPGGDPSSSLPPFHHP